MMTTYFLNKLICSIFLKFGIQQTAVTDNDLPDSVLLEQEWIGFLILFGVFVAQVLEHDRLFALWAGVQVLKWLVICATYFLQRSPFVWGILTHEDLTRIALSAQVDLFRVDLIWDVDQEHIEEVIADVVRLEDDLHFIGLIGCDRSLLRNEDKWNLLAIVFHSMHEALQVEIDWERRHILNLERLLSCLSSQNITKWHNTILRRDLDLRAHSCTLEQHRHHCVVRKHDDSLLLDLLEQRLKLDHDRLSLAWLDRSHSIKNREATEWAKGLQSQCFLHHTHVFDKDFLRLFKGDRNFTELEYIRVWH